MFFQNSYLFYFILIFIHTIIPSLMFIIPKFSLNLFTHLNFLFINVIIKKFKFIIDVWVDYSLFPINSEILSSLHFKYLDILYFKHLELNPLYMQSDIYFKSNNINFHLYSNNVNWFLYFINKYIFDLYLVNIQVIIFISTFNEIILNSMNDL